ncbi:CvpA family protein [Paeniroseomonas aquatica]|uniref:CvpA family protein n=1 Tax=Paeniroseomonas aquatica TaxID=373043 RepID=UPI00361FD0E2
MAGRCPLGRRRLPHRADHPQAHHRQRGADGAESALGGTDRALGLVFGVARGAFLVILAYILGGMVLPASERWPEPVREARSLPLVIDGAHWLVARLPAEYRPRVATPPARPEPTQEDFLRPPARNRT